MSEATRYPTGPIMICERCGIEAQAMAQFCATCGAPLAVAGASLAPGPISRSPVGGYGRGFSGRVAPVPGQSFFRCPHCGVPAAPVPYFSRGVNVLKALVLMVPFNLVGPLVLFLLRKDRMICSVCRQLLSGETSALLLQGLSGQGGWAALPAGGAALLYEGDRELGLLEHKSRRLRKRALTWGTLAGGLAAIGVLTAAGAHGHELNGFLLAATPPGLLAAIAAFRSRSLGLLAQTQRARQRRLRVLELARVQGGRLSVSYVAAELRIELGDAEVLLGSMVDGHRVEMDVDDDGRITYVFTELVGV